MEQSAETLAESTAIKIDNGAEPQNAQKDAKSSTVTRIETKSGLPEQLVSALTLYHRTVAGKPSRLLKCLVLVTCQPQTPDAFAKLCGVAKTESVALDVFLRVIETEFTDKHNVEALCAAIERETRNDRNPDCGC